MNKKQVFRDVVKHTPRFVHSIMTKGKIRELESIFLSDEEVALCENDRTRKERVVRESCEKHNKRSTSVSKQIDKYMNGAECLKAIDDKEYLRTDMFFCYFAYGYIPEEYVFYRLFEHVDGEYRRQYITEITRLCCRYAMNDFTVSTYSNKDVEYERLKPFYKRDAVIIRGEQDRANFKMFADKHPRFIEKPAISSMGKGVCLIDLHAENMTPDKYFASKWGGYAAA